MPTQPESDPDALIARLIAERPPMHVAGDRTLTDYGINERTMAFLKSHVRPGNRTIETGSGLSTIMFLLLGAEHTAISPDGGEPARIRSYCDAHGISAQRYTPIVGNSESVLPQLSTEPAFDLALVDGNHAFPAPAIDWFYLTRLLKDGGIIIVDDVQLWPCRIVADFLDAEEVWQPLLRTNRMAAYRLLKRPEAVLSRWWGQQPYVVLHSNTGIKSAVKRSIFYWRQRLARSGDG
jgi:predicted O-methyltransferase YrrM